MKTAMTLFFALIALTYSTAAYSNGRKFSCAEIREGARQFGVNALLAYARRNGYTEKEIKKYMKCLKKGK